MTQSAPRPTSEAPASVLPTFSASRNDFYATVQRRARALLAERGDRSHAPLRWQVISFALFFVVVALFYPAFVLGSVTAAAALGVLRAVTVLGPGHSLSHLSLFRSSRANTLGFRLVAPVLLTTLPVWRLTHVLHHHLYTLTDADMQDHYPFKRVQSSLPHRFWHRYQHLYMWPLYVLGLPLWQGLDLVRACASLSTGVFLGRPLPLKLRLETLLGQAITVFLHIVLPFLFLPFWHAALVAMVANVIAGLIVVLQIVVNHEVRPTTSLRPIAQAADWGEHQVHTSHNYSPTSTFALHLSGGLNYQIEHHLFPRVYYLHYPVLAPLVREVCAEFNLPYHSSATFSAALRSHYDLLVEMGQTPVAVPA